MSRRTVDQTPAEGLQNAWDISNELMRRWMRETLASEGIMLDDLVSSHRAATPATNSSRIRR